MPGPVYVTKPSMPPPEEYAAEISDIWGSRILTNMGPKHRALEAALLDYLGAPNMALFANGHLALEAALQVLELPKGGEVVTTPFTFVSTTAAISRSGLTPIFCDINENDGTINPALIERLITPRTCAVLPVHVYGNLCDTNAIEDIAARYGLPVIYDAAHAFGVFRKKDGAKAGVFGDISMFSFHATKVFHTVEGGGLAFRDPSLAEKLNRWRNFGYSNGKVVAHGCNAKMSETHAAMGLCNLRHIEEYIAARRQIAELYAERLSNRTGLTLITPQPGVESNYSYFPIRVDAARFGSSRDELFEALAGANIHARKYFYPLTSQMSVYRARQPLNTPVAERLTEEVLALPLYPGLEADDVMRICDVVIRGGKP